MPDLPPPHLPDSQPDEEHTDTTRLRQELEEAFNDASFAASVDVGRGDSLVSVTLYSASKSPFKLTPEHATSWLSREAIDASARMNDGFNVVIDLRTAQSAERLTRVLLDPHIRAHTTASALQDVLNGHQIAHTVEVDFTARTLELTLIDNADLDTAATFAELLGAPCIDVQLDLTRNRHLRRLADRLTWLITGTTGSQVMAEATPGCAHEPDQVTITLTLAQARLLNHRLDAAPQAGKWPEDVNRETQEIDLSGDLLGHNTRHPQACSRHPSPRPDGR